MEKETLDGIVDKDKFLKHHSEQVGHRSQKDVFFIWTLIILISVIAAHFILNFSGSSPTGFITAAESTTGNISILLGAMLVVFVGILITALTYVGITKKDY
ncbi:MAG: hypothetical protein KKF46_06410 [Nanoarchaeota archaeon]|nr:hypothetical protein [Nanoarchaeota archaeon]MBU1321961.1 hypothetical protein [Nanoarchaeota archaeon]MBU1597957.1 hypothetical protein [Nanoarchaeota archaeon]MBU2441194.1 hypothetical protein [Nanoarchaeota archaeon]